MGILSTVLPAAAPYIAGAKIAAYAGVAILILGLLWRDHRLATEVARDTVAIQQAAVDNRSNVKTIADLKAANAQWVAADTANKEHIDELSSQLSESADSLSAVRAQLSAAQAAEKSPAALALRAVRIDSADAALAERLRSEARGAHAYRH